MNCTETRRRLDALLLGGETGREGAATRRHLASCPDCRDEAERIRRIDARIRDDLAAVRSPHALWQKIDRQIALIPQPASRPSPRIGWRGSWGLGLAGALLLIGLWSARRPQSPLPVQIPSPHSVTARATPVRNDAAAQYILAAWRDPLADQVSLATRYASVAGSGAEGRP